MNKKQSLFHIAKRDSLPWYKAALIRGGAIVLALIVCAIVTTPSSSQMRLASASGSLRLTNTPLPLRQERSIMLPVMPIEPTRPMPSRSSGTNDMEMPLLRIFIGSRPTSSFSAPPSGG